MSRTLSDDVRLLGDTLGAVIRAHGGAALFERVESMRRDAKQAREEQGERAEAARARLEHAARGMGAETALEVVRAFALWFELVNQAEDVHRARTLRRREREGGPEGVPESLAAVAAELAGRGVTPHEALAALDDVSLRFVLTAHPTEARRRTTERLLERVRGGLEQLDRRDPTPGEEAGIRRRLRAQIEALWEHAPHRREQPSVLDEARTGLWYLERVVLDVLPRAQRSLRRALEELGAPPTRPLAIPVRFGSWMGSDRDGNPHVTDDVTGQVLELQRDIALRRYVADLDALLDPLAASARRIPPHAGLERALARAAGHVPEIVDEVEARSSDEPLRRLVRFARERVERARRFTDGAYASAEELVADLEVIRDVLRSMSARALADDGLEDLLVRVRCFGFCLAPLEVREDARVHRRVVAELLGDPDYPARPSTERIRRLEGLALPEGAAADALSDEARRLLSLLRRVGELRRRFGPDAIATWVISMCHAPADAVEVMQLAEAAGLGGALDVVPLLETGAALEGAGGFAADLFGVERYRGHLRERGDLQEVMVGYSDSMKENGILTSRVRVREAQRALARECERHGIALRVFHGRGGSVSRGGGPSHRAIRALPGEAFSGRIKLTEQGETRASHFGSPDLALRYLEQTLGAAWLHRCEARRQERGEAETVVAALERLAERGRRAWRELVDGRPLLRFFTAATPFETVASLHIASRPAARTRDGEPSLEDLRAIPWVFAWSQARLVLTGWYGVGSAFAQEDPADLGALLRDSPFLRDLVDNVEMTLAKADLSIASRYAALCEDAEVREGVFAPIREEFERSRRAVLAVKGARELLGDDEVLRESIRLRNPYVDPLSYVQVEALRRRRAGGDDAEAWSRVARLSVQGIAAGLRNTG